MTSLKMLTADDKIAEIRRLYFNTTKQTIQQDLAKALDLLKSMQTEDERERAVVFMEGLAEMRKDWEREKSGGAGKKPGRPGAKGARPGAKGSGARAGGAKGTKTNGGGARSGGAKGSPRVGTQAPPKKKSEI